MDEDGQGQPGPYSDTPRLAWFTAIGQLHDLKHMIGLSLEFGMLRSYKLSFFYIIYLF